MIAIVDYGAGNLVSVKKAFGWLGADCEITSDPSQVSAASEIVLPGVGHFASTDVSLAPVLEDAISDARNGRTRFSVFVLACSGCSSAARKLRKFRAGLFNGGASSFPR